MRLEEGAKLSLADGQGGLFWGTIESVQKNKLFVRIDRHRVSDPKRPIISLIYGMAKASQTETVLQKATELGVDHLVLAVCQRSISRPKDLPRKEERLREIIRQAARQSGRVFLPQLRLAPRLGDALAESRGADLRLVTSFSGVCLSTISDDTWKGASEIAIVVGPEGGLTDAEEAQALDHDYLRVRLGELTMRTETAAIASLSLINFLSGRFSR